MKLNIWVKTFSGHRHTIDMMRCVVDIDIKAKGWGICLDSIYPLYKFLNLTFSPGRSSCLTRFLIIRLLLHSQECLNKPIWRMLAGGLQCSLQMFIEPSICAPGTHYGCVPCGIQSLPDTSMNDRRQDSNPQIWNPRTFDFEPTHCSLRQRLWIRTPLRSLKRASISKILNKNIFPGPLSQSSSASILFLNSHIFLTSVDTKYDDIDHILFKGTKINGLLVSCLWLISCFTISTSYIPVETEFCCAHFNVL